MTEKRSPGRVGEVLRKKYKTPQALLAALGLDARDLGVDIVGDKALDTKEAHIMSTKKTVLSSKGSMVMGALHHFLFGGTAPRLAADAKIDWAKLVGPVTAKNFKEKKGIIVAGIKEQTRGKLAKDASVDGLVELLDGLEKVEGGDDLPMLETKPNAGLPLKEKEEPEEDEEDDMPMDADAHAGLRAFLEEKGMSPEDIEAACATVGDAELETKDLPGNLGTKGAAEEGEDEENEDMEDKKPAKDKRAKDEPPPFKGKPEVGGGMSKDSVNKLVQKAVAEERARQTETREAEREVRPWVGQLVMAHDSAEDVYRTALTALGVEIEDVPPSVAAYRAILKQVPQPGRSTSNRVAQDGAMAEDSDATADFAKTYPMAARVKHV